MKLLHRCSRGPTREDVSKKKGHEDNPEKKPLNDPERRIRHQEQGEPTGSFTPENKVNPRHSNGSDYYREFLINAALNKI